MLSFFQKILKSDNKENTFYILTVILCAATLPLYKIASSPLLILFGLFILIKLFKFKMKLIKELSNNKINLIFIVLFFFTIFSLSYSSNLNNGFKEVKNLLPLIIFPLLFTFVKLNNNQLLFLLKTFLVGCLLAFVISISFQIWHFLKGEEFSFQYIKLVEVLWMHPTYLSLYLNFAIIVSYYLYIKKNISLLSFIVSSLTFTLFILLLSSRMQIFNLAIVFMLVVAHVLKNNFSFKTFSVIAIIPLLVLLVFLANNKIVDRFSYMKKLDYDITSQNHKDWNGANVRIAIWKCTLDLFEANKLLGVGIGDADEELLESYKKNEFMFAYNLKYVAHNQFIQFLLSIGVFGLSIYLIVFVYLFYYSIQNKHFLLFSLSVLLFFTGISESFLKMQSGIVFFSLMILLLFQYKPFQKDLKH